MDLQVLTAAAALFAKAAALTLRISIVGIVLSIFVGLLCAAVRLLRVPLAAQVAKIYIELSRNTPLIVQLVFLYYGLPKLGVTLSGEACAVIGLTFLGGSYMAEALRSGLEAVPNSQYESGIALGLTRLQVIRTILLPQAMITAIPAVTANIIFLIKETSVVSIIALPDLVYQAKEMMGVGHDTNEAMLLLVLFYFLILVPVALLARFAERRSRAYIGVNE